MRGASLAGHRQQLVDGDLERGPHVKQDTVPVQPAFRGTVGLGPPKAVKAGAQGVLELGQGRDPSGLVAHRRQVADLGHAR